MFYSVSMRRLYILANFSWNLWYDLGFSQINLAYTQLNMSSVMVKKVMRWENFLFVICIIVRLENDTVTTCNKKSISQVQFIVDWNIL